MTNARCVKKNVSSQKKRKSSNAPYMKGGLIPKKMAVAMATNDQISPLKTMNKIFLDKITIQKNKDFFLPNEIKKKSFQQAFKDFIDNIHCSKINKELKAAKRIVKICKEGMKLYSGKKLLGYTVEMETDITALTFLKNQSYKLTKKTNWKKNSISGHFITSDMLKRAKKLIRENK